MYNLVISLAIGLAASLALALGTELGVVAAVFPGLLAASIAYFVLARRSLKKLEAIFSVMQRDLQAQKIDRAIQTLKDGFVLAPWQFLVAAQLNSNIGMLLYIKGEMDAALPYLEKSFSRHWIARGMLAVTRYRKRDMAAMAKVFGDAVSSSKKEGVLWSAWAWILEKEGRHEEAIAILARAVKANPADEKLKTSMQALQNGKKLKLGKLYGEQWFQFLLERPPPELVGAGFRGGGRRVIYRG